MISYQWLDFQGFLDRTSSEPVPSSVHRYPASNPRAETSQWTFKDSKSGLVSAARHLTRSRISDTSDTLRPITYLTRSVSWQQQSFWFALHSVLKAEKVWENMRKSSNCYFCSTNAPFLQYKWYFFGMQEKKIECTVQTFAESVPLWSKFLPPYGTSRVFTTLWCGFCHLMLNFWSAVQKSVAFF